jgi:hypothetical protein
MAPEIPANCLIHLKVEVVNLSYKCKTRMSAIKQNPDSKSCAFKSRSEGKPP